jgi:hypothetical protein
MNGKGTLYYEKDRPAYSGDFIDDHFHGFGVLMNEYSTYLESSFDFSDFNNIKDYWIKY